MTDWQKLARAETHPLRMRILEAVEASAEPMSATSLVPVVDASLGRVSYHLQELAKAEIVEFSHSVPRRGALEKFYRAASS